MRLAIISSAVILAWQNDAAWAIHHPSSRTQNNGNVRRWRTHHPSESSNASCRRQLSAEDQLDILKLGFIPRSRLEGCMRGGGMEAHCSESSHVSVSCRQQLSAEDQLDILKLGFIPRSRLDADIRGGGMEVSNSKTKKPNPLSRLSRFGRGGGMDVVDGKNRGPSKCRRQLSKEDQLDILRLGFIPPTCDDGDVPNKNEMKKYLSIRGGATDGSSSRWSKARHASKPSENHCATELSEADQLDILQLGLIPPSKDEEPRTLLHHGGQGDSVESAKSKSSRKEVRSKTRRHPNLSKSKPKSKQTAQHCSEELSEADQLDILQLGLIPPSSKDEEPRTFLHQGRGGGIDIVGKAPLAMPPLAFASIMALLAGYSDVLCLKKFHTYVAMQSGNVVTMSMSLAVKDWKSAAWKASLIGSYFAGTTCVRSIENMCKQKGTESRSHLKIIAPIVAAVFVVANKAIVGSPTVGPERNLYLLALGYGMVYATAFQALDGTITNLLTGHITRVGTAVSDRFLGADKEWSKGIEKSVCILGSFAVGGVLCGRMDTLLPEEFPIFALLGVVYAVVLALF